eukprot:gene3632-4161_t
MASSRLVLQVAPLSALADWVIKIDGMAHPDFQTFLGTNERRQLLKVLYKNNIKGGIIKSGDDEEWNYTAIGSLSTIDGMSDAKIDYHWDGEWLKSSVHSPTLGIGRFNGVHLAWYARGEAAQPDLTYFWDEKEREYSLDRKEFTFKWTRHFLASKFGSGEWIVEGHVPQPVVMFLQLIKYRRIGGPVSPFAADIRLSIPGSESVAGTMNLTPFTKGQALINVTHALFNSPLADDKSQAVLSQSLQAVADALKDSCESSEDDELIVEGASLAEEEDSDLRLSLSASPPASFVETEGSYISINLTPAMSDISPTSPAQQDNYELNLTPNKRETLRLLNDTIFESTKLRSSTNLEDLFRPLTPVLESTDDCQVVDNNIEPQEVEEQTMTMDQDTTPTFEPLVIEPLSLEPLIEVPEEKEQEINDTNTNITVQQTTTTTNDQSTVDEAATEAAEQPSSAVVEREHWTPPPSPSAIPRELRTPVRENRSMSEGVMSPDMPASPIFPSTPLGSVMGPTSKSIRRPLAKSRSSDKVLGIIDQIVASSKPMRLSFCLACNLPITGHMMMALGNHFHKACFQCTKCHKELGTKTFYRQGLSQTNSANDIIVPVNATTTSNSITSTPDMSVLSKDTPTSHNNTPTSPLSPRVSSGSISRPLPKYLCETCFNEVCPICPKCNASVMYRCVNALGKKWHIDHFCCVECTEPLVGRSFFEMNGQPYCANDYHRIFGESNNNIQNNNESSATSSPTAITTPLSTTPTTTNIKKPISISSSTSTLSLVEEQPLHITNTTDNCNIINTSRTETLIS